MSVLLIFGPKCTLMSHGQYADGTDEQTDGRQSPDRYITLSAKSGHRNKGLNRATLCITVDVL